MRTARTRPMRATTSMLVRATAKGLPSGSLTATRTEPTRAVPSEDPRLETLRDRPEISPWSWSGKLDWTMLTEEVNMVPTPAPNSSSPGIHRQIPAFVRTSVVRGQALPVDRLLPAALNDAGRLAPQDRRPSQRRLITRPHEWFLLAITRWSGRAGRPGVL